MLTAKTKIFLMFGFVLFIVGIAMIIFEIIWSDKYCRPNKKLIISMIVMVLVGIIMFGLGMHFGNEDEAADQKQQAQYAADSNYILYDERYYQKTPLESANNTSEEFVLVSFYSRGHKSYSLRTVSNGEMTTKSVSEYYVTIISNKSIEKAYYIQDKSDHYVLYLPEDYKEEIVNSLT